MFSSAEKTTSPSIAVQQKAAGGSFFRKAGEEGFFGEKQNGPFFNSSVIQPKLTVSSPDDPQEKEADEVAEKVMRMPEPQAVNSTEKKEEKLQAKDEQGFDRSGALFINSTEIQPAKKERLQAKLFSVHRSTESTEETEELSSESGSNYALQPKHISLHRSDVLQQSGRGPPANSPPFEHTLQSTRGSGSPLPADTRQYMESRFGADFSSVRIHTGSASETLNRTIHAQAFTHGSDIYFNAGKFTPHTADGSFLLAHELTHTIQQGAVSSNAHQSSYVSRKLIIQRSTEGSVPPQLTNAVARAKTQEGKINANTVGPDGFRTGWENLVDIFKTTFGEDKIVSGNSGPFVPGSVSEMDIKKKRMQKNALVVDPASASGTKYGSRDAMPSWCGIFVFWALNKSGVPMPKWQLGRNVMKPQAAYPPRHIPRPGDIAYRSAYSHFAIVESASGTSVRTVNGNTAGEDNLGGQVQVKEHPISNWTAFFNPLLLMQGELGSGESLTPERPKTLDELRRELFGVDRKAEESEEEHGDEEVEVQAKTKESNWQVDAGGQLVETSVEHNRKLQAKEEKEKEEEKEVTGIPAIIQKKEHEACHCNDTGNSGAAEKEKGEYAAADASSFASVAVQRYASGMSERDGEEMDRGPPVQAKAEQGVIQRSVIDDALAYIDTSTVLGCLDITSFDTTKACVLRKAQEVALHIPGYRALRVVLREDPITGQRVERNGRNFIEAAFDIMPGGRLLHQKLNEIQLLDTAAEWIDRQIGAVVTIVSNVVSEVTNFWNSLNSGSVLSPMDVLRRGVNIVVGFINSVIDFAKKAAGELLTIVKNFLLSKIVDFIKEHTTAYPLLTVILGRDPVTEQRVDPTGANILNAILELGGEEGRMQRTQMQETGTFQKVAGYIDQGIAVFSGAYDQVVQAFRNIWNVVRIESLMDPVGTFRQIYNQFAEPIQRVWNFVRDVGSAILRFIKEVLMRRLSQWARGVRGYPLVTVIIGKDPFTNQVVPATVENIIHGFMSLMEGGEEQYQQMVESGAVGRAAAQIRAAVARLNMTPAYVVQLFTELWNSFSLRDLANPVAAFQRILARFGEPIGRLVAFIIEIVKIVVRVILEIMNFPFGLINNIIAKAMMAFELIKRDPIGFLKNLLRAIKEGFMQFFDNILSHLFSGLKAWFLSEVQAAGIPIPTDFSVMSVIKWLLVVLDITMEKIWKKLEERIGKPKVDKIKGMIAMAEKVANAAGEAYAFIQDVRERGFMTVMVEKIKEQLSNVWDMVLGAVRSFVMDQIIKKVTTKLLSMLDPTGIMAVVNSAIALYKAIQSFIRYLRQMLEIVNSFVEGTLQIAQGATKKAADFLEGALGRGIPIVIGFLANQVGLNLSERLKEALELVREKVDKGLTWVIDKLVVIVEKLISLGKAAVKAILRWLGLEKKFKAKDGKDHRLYFSGSEESPVLMVQSNPQAFSVFIESVEVGTDEKKKEAKGKAKPIAGQIDSKKKEPLAGKTDEEKEESKKEKIKAVEDLLDQLAEPAAELFGDVEAAGEPEVNFTTQDAGHALTMTAKKLNKKQALKGSPPTSSNTSSYETLNTRRQGEKASYYVKGHMLNENVGGKGVWENLTPLSRKGNSNHEGEVESLVKAAFSSGAVIEYNVTAKYGYGNNSASIPADDPQKEQKLKIIAEEKNVPTKLECEAWILEKQGDVFERKKGGSIVSAVVENTVEQDAASYILVGSPGKPDIYLNSSPAVVIATIDGFASLANKIVKAHKESGKKRFNSYEELSNAKMQDQKTEIFSEPGEKDAVKSLSKLNYVKLYKA